MPHIRQNLIIGATAETVYKAIVTQEGLSAWWTPQAAAKEEINSIARFPFGKDYFKEMEIVELNPFSLVRWHCIKGDAEWVGTDLSFRMASGNKQRLLDANPEIAGQVQQQKHEQCTLLSFSHDSWDDYTPMFAECSYTWGQFLRSLKLLCETGKGKPWPDQH